MARQLWQSRPNGWCEPGCYDGGVRGSSGVASTQPQRLRKQRAPRRAGRLLPPRPHHLLAACSARNLPSTVSPRLRVQAWPALTRAAALAAYRSTCPAALLADACVCRARRAAAAQAPPRPHRLLPGSPAVEALLACSDLGAAIQLRQPQTAAEWAAVYAAELSELRRMLQVSGRRGRQPGLACTHPRRPGEGARPLLFAPLYPCTAAGMPSPCLGPPGGPPPAAPSLSPPETTQPPSAIITTRAPAIAAGERH